MKKIYLISLIFVIILSSFTYSLSTDDLIAYYKLDEGSGNIVDSHSTNDMTCSNIETYDVSAIINTGLSFESSTPSYCYINDNAEFSAITNKLSVCAWINMESLNNFQSIVNKWNGGTNKRTFWLGIYNTNKLSFDLSTTGSNTLSTQSTSTLTSETWYFVCGVYNGVNTKLYIDGSLDKTSGSIIGNLYDSNEIISIGIHDNLGLSAFDGLIDEVMIFDVELTSDDITELYNSGNGFTYPFSDEEIPNIELNYISLINNTENFNDDNLLITYNFCEENINRIGGVFECDLNHSIIINNIEVRSFLNSSSNECPDISSNFTHLETFEQNTSDLMNFEIVIKCNDNTSINASSGKYYYNIDKINPEILINTNIINNTEFYLFDNMYINVSFEDENLFAYNISLFHNNVLGIKNLKENYFAENLTTTKAINISNRILTDLGDYNVIFSVWDSHTKNEIKEYKIEKEKDLIIFEDDIKIKGYDLKNNNIKTEKLKDKYNFEMEFNKGNKIKKIELESKNLFYIPNSKYKAHFVDFVNKKWIDFESNDIENIKVNKISDNKYIIEFESDKDIILFNSIGDLNFNEEEYFFNVINTPIPNTSINLNLTGLEVSVNNINITMSYFTFWIVFIIILVIPEFNKTNYEILNILRVIFLFILFVTLFNIDYGFTIGIVNLLKLIILVLILGFVSIGKDENNTNDTH